MIGVALIAYAGLLATQAISPRGRAELAGAGFFDLGTGPGMRAALLALGLYLLQEVARFLPVGVLVALSLPWRPGGRLRIVPAMAAAGTASLVIAAAVVTIETGRPWQWPGPSDLLLPAMGCGLGILTGLVWLAGPGTWRRALLVLGVAAVGGPILLGLALLAASEPVALVRETPAVTSEEKRRLYHLLRDKNPSKIEPGGTRILALGSRDLDLLLAWGLPLVLGEGRARARVELAAPDRVTLALTLRLPVPGAGPRYLNLVGGARVGIAGRTLTLGEPTLRLGRLALPERPLGWLAPVLGALVRAERRARPVLAGLESLDIGPGRLTLVYGRMDLPPGLLAGLIWGEASGGMMRLAVRSHLEGLLAAAPRLPPGEERLGAAVQAAFARARERSAASPPVLENRAALLALGILLGHSRLEQFVGRVMDERDWRRAAPLARVPLRGRADWTRHFFVSAALTVLSAQAPSDAIGLFKEELDAGGGSGFSFADLLADRAGTTFALLATRDPEAARAFQERLAGGFRVDDFFPEAADLPENVQDAELQARYGGVGGPLFRHYEAEVERRLWSLPAYRDLAPPGGSAPASKAPGSGARPS